MRPMKLLTRLTRQIRQRLGSWFGVAVYALPCCVLDNADDRRVGVDQQSFAFHERRERLDRKFKAIVGGVTLLTSVCLASTSSVLVARAKRLVASGRESL